MENIANTKEFEIDLGEISQNAENSLREYLDLCKSFSGIVTKRLLISFLVFIATCFTVYLFSQSYLFSSLFFLGSLFIITGYVIMGIGKASENIKSGIYGIMKYCIVIIEEICKSSEYDEHQTPHFSEAVELMTAKIILPVARKTICRDILGKIGYRLTEKGIKTVKKSILNAIELKNQAPAGDLIKKIKMILHNSNKLLDITFGGAVVLSRVMGGIAYVMGFLLIILLFAVRNYITF